MQNTWLRLNRIRGGKHEMIAINFAHIANVESAEGYPAFQNAGARLVYQDDSVIFVAESQAAIMAALGTASLA